MATATGAARAICDGDDAGRCAGGGATDASTESKSSSLCARNGGACAEAAVLEAEGRVATEAKTNSANMRVNRSKGRTTQARCDFLGLIVIYADFVARF